MYACVLRFLLLFVKNNPKSLTINNNNIMRQEKFSLRNKENVVNQSRAMQNIYGSCSKNCGIVVVVVVVGGGGVSSIIITISGGGGNVHIFPLSH